MGKKARERAARRVAPAASRRAANQAGKDSASAQDGQDAAGGISARDLRWLRRINEEVATLFAGDQRCVEASALAVRAAADLSIVLTPQPVALAAQYRGHSAALGRRALDAWGGDMSAFGEVTDELTGTGWDTAGHMVVVHRPSRWVFDPTLGQLSTHLRVRLGLLAEQVASLEPDDGAWHFSTSDLSPRYYLCDDDATWVEGFESSLQACRLTASDLASIVRSDARGIIVRS